MTAEIVVPQEPGTYQSHWRLTHEGVRFGHRVWCSIIVDPPELLEVTAAEEEIKEEEVIAQMSDPVLVESRRDARDKAMREWTKKKVKINVQGQTDEDAAASVKALAAPAEQGATKV